MTTKRGVRQLIGSADGATAVETAVLIWPFLMIVLALFQFVFLHYNQDSLSDALFALASQPSSASGDTQAAYKTSICGRNAFQSNCTAKLKVERFKLANVPLAQTAVAGTSWEGASGDVVVLRASLDTLTVVAFIPTLKARESVVYALP